MRALLLAALLVPATCCVPTAFADALDFKAHILDPPATSFPTFSIQSRQFSVTFSACEPGELPDDMTASGCYAAVNRSNLDWTSLQITFPNTSELGSQAVSCAPAPSANVFSETDCTLDTSENLYDLSFGAGVIRNGDLFFITEDGVPFADFPTGTGFVTSVAGETPEPAPFFLLGTGLLLVGAHGFRRFA